MKEDKDFDYNIRIETPTVLSLFTITSEGKVLVYDKEDFTNDDLRKALMELMEMRK